MCGELLFPCQFDVQSSGSLMRQISIPTTFMAVADYKNILVAAVTGELSYRHLIKKTYNGANGACVDSIAPDKSLFSTKKYFHFSHFSMKTLCGGAH